MRKIEHIRQDLESTDIAIARKAMTEIIEEPTDDAIQILCEMLSSVNPVVRSRAAGVIRDLREQRALPFLMASIEEPRNNGNRGSLVYAMTALDCGGCFSFLFNLALTADNYEVENHALSILREQRFLLDRAALDDASARLRVFAQQVQHRAEIPDLILELNRVLSRVDQETQPSETSN